MRVFPPTKEGIFPPMEGIPPMEGSANTVEDPQNVMLFSCFWRRGFAAKCTMFRNYNSHISLIFTNLCNFSFANPDDVHFDAPQRQWAGDEAAVSLKLWAFSVHSAARNDLAPELDVSALLSLFLCR